MSSGMWLPYQSNIASSNSSSMALDNHYAPSHSPIASSEASSGSNSPISSNTSSTNKLSLSNLIQTPQSISSFVPNYTEEEKLGTSTDSGDLSAFISNNQSLKNEPQYQINCNQNNTSTDNDLANSSDSTESSTSADSSPTYRSPQVPSYNAPISHMYQHAQQPSVYNPYSQYNHHNHDQSHYNYFNVAHELNNSYYNSASNQNSAESISIKSEISYPNSTGSHTMSTNQQDEKPRPTMPLSNMLNNMVNPAAALYQNTYAQAAAASAYYNNPYYAQHQYSFPSAADAGLNNGYGNASPPPAEQFIKPEPLSERHIAQKLNQVQNQPQHHQQVHSQQQVHQPHQSLMPNYEFNANGNNLLQNQNCAVPDFSSNNTMPKNQITNPNIKVKLQDMNLWKQFNQIGTEMIITKCGRRMFPSLRVSVSGLDATSKYVMVVDIVPVDDNRYKYHNCEWIVSGKAEAHFVGRGYLHPDSPLTGSQWSKQIISFHKLKLTNNPFDRSGHIILNSMHKYVPRVHIIEEGKSINTFVLTECVFTAVTAYQNELITKLKIEYNPFAKGFRDGQNRQGFRAGAAQGKRSSDDESDGLLHHQPQQQQQRMDRPFMSNMGMMNSQGMSGAQQHMNHVR